MNFVDNAMDSILLASETIALQFFKVLRYPLDSGQRIHFLYLLTSLLFAIYCFYHSSVSGKDSRKPSLKALLAYLFPEKIWKTRSAWLDVRYFFLHQMLRLSIYGPFLLGISYLVTASSSHYVSVMLDGWTVPDSENVLPIMVALYALFSVALLDFSAYVIHYLQHRIPLLWEFHKVHHSPTVLHPLTNYREHPIDNICYAITTGSSTGFAAGVFVALLGYAPEMPTLYGVGMFTFLFNILGYNLRHSHIWVRWPGKLAYVFGCPAHHQIHHSYHPQHIDKNFAFMFPVWDVLFGTFCLPENNDDVKYGLGENQEDEFTSCLQLYFLPFRNLFKRLRYRKL